MGKKCLNRLSRHKSSYLDYFDKTIKFTGSIRCVIIILRVLQKELSLERIFSFSTEVIFHL